MEMARGGDEVRDGEGKIKEGVPGEAQALGIAHRFWCNL